MKKTPLNSVHKTLNAKMVDFAGWEMPVQYNSIIKEHRAVREKCGLFDVSHMGEIIISGKKALDFVQYLITNDASVLDKGQVLYTPMCYEHGGIVDDLLVYCLSGNKYLFVVNASNIDKDYNWIVEHKTSGTDVENAADDYAQLALQGPLSEQILSKITEIDLHNLKNFWFVEGEINGSRALVSKTGYTGEVGYEIYLAPDRAISVWESLMEAGQDEGLLPAGLGARNTLRLEKRLCLYGNDIDESTHPFAAGLNWTVKFDKERFIGKTKLQGIKEEGYKRKLSGFIMEERGIPRHGYEIYSTGSEDEVIGEVTSGSFSPTLKKNIGLGYLEKSRAQTGEKILIKIRDNYIEARIVETPFV